MIECKKERISKNSHCSSRYKKSKKILSVKKVTDDKHVHDSKMLSQLVGEDITKSKNMAIDKVLADGVHIYGGNDVFRRLTQ